MFEHPLVRYYENMSEKTLVLLIRNAEDVKRHPVYTAVYQALTNRGVLDKPAKNKKLYEKGLEFLKERPNFLANQLRKINSSKEITEDPVKLVRETFQGEIAESQ